MQFLDVTLQAARDRVPALRDYYLKRLGIDRTDGDHVAIGVTTLSFVAAEGEPFYHFALLVPGDRFVAALAWAAERVELLPGGAIDELVFRFDSWDARACYFHDPAGNIVELIAHRRVGQNGLVGDFDPSELLGFSELGLVGNPPEIADGLGQLGLRLWDGELTPTGLAFYGERARTFILSPEGRGWLPTRRPAEPHPVAVVLSGPATGEVAVGNHQITARCLAD
jgi:catechol 2,3-dioxygenase-like lactoylglutathione lyase family enzyme